MVEAVFYGEMAQVRKICWSRHSVRRMGRRIEWVKMALGIGSGSRWRRWFLVSWGLRLEMLERLGRIAISTLSFFPL